jgi:two-component system chemotaxis response regulator CheY
MSKRILVADDALIIREIIKDRAIEAGFEVVGEATNGKEAFEKYCELKPDIATMDLVMPEYDGLFGLREIIKAHPEAKVVVVSALDQKDVLKEAFRAGASDFVVKPFDQANLIETLLRLIA